MLNDVIACNVRKVVLKRNFIVSLQLPAVTHISYDYVATVDYGFIANNMKV